MPVCDAHARKHVGDVFGRRVAAGARRMRAAADAGERSIEARNAHFHRRVDVRQREAPRVMEMAAPEAVARERPRLLEQVAHARRIGITDGVGDADAVRAGIQQRMRATAGLPAAPRGPAACIRTPCLRRLRSASSTPPRRGPHGSSPARRPSRPASCARWRDCARRWPTAARAAGPRRIRSRARRP